MAEWFRSWHGAPTDPKWAVIARKAQAPRAVVVAIAWSLLDIASQAADRGAVRDIDIEVLAAALDLEESVVQAVLSAMREKGRFISEDGRLTAWEKRQPKSEDPTAAERMRRHRERQKSGAVPTDDPGLQDEETQDGVTAVTERNDRNGYTEQNRTEQSRPKQSRADERAHDVGRKCLAILGKLGDPTWNYGLVFQWLADGADPERHIFATLKTMAANGTAARAKSLAYFTPAIMEAMQRSAAAPTTASSSRDPEYDRSRAYVQLWLESGDWPAHRGPKPGEPGCRIDKRVLAEFAEQIQARTAA